MPVSVAAPCTGPLRWIKSHADGRPYRRVDCLWAHNLRSGAPRGVLRKNEGHAMTQTLLPALKKHPFVAEFLPEHVDLLAALAKEVRFDEGQVIFHEGDLYSVFYLLSEGMVALELEEPDQVLRVQTLYAGDELDWSAVLPNAGKHFQARALRPVTALAFEGSQLLESFKRHPDFGVAFMLRLMGVVSERLRATRVQLLDMYSPVAKRAGA
jgi:CRP/FNR family transcriptional regulator, cyclic AMP receptor protein